MLLPIDQLASIMASDELNVSSEEEVYKASMEWINYDLANRKHLLPKVLQNVRFPLMTALFLVGKFIFELQVLHVILINIYNLRYC